MSSYSFDPAHSEVTFKVKHLMISNVTGHFSSFEATVESEKEDFSDAKIDFHADVNSISTKNEQRDAHLKSADFFDAENYPKMEFKSSNFKKVEGSSYKLEGELTIRGVSKSIVLDVEYAGTMSDPYGNEKHGFEIVGKINRKDFGLNWSAVTEAGGIVVSDEVRILVDAQFVKNQ
ncbi:MAG: YceI family protein [Bacteroidia bacterium]